MAVIFRVGQKRDNIKRRFAKGFCPYILNNFSDRFNMDKKGRFGIHNRNGCCLRVRNIDNMAAFWLCYTVRSVY